MAITHVEQSISSKKNTLTLTAHEPLFFATRSAHEKESKLEESKK